MGWTNVANFTNNPTIIDHNPIEEIFFKNLANCKLTPKYYGHKISLVVCLIYCDIWPGQLRCFIGLKNRILFSLLDHIKIY